MVAYDELMKARFFSQVVKSHNPEIMAFGFDEPDFVFDVDPSE